MGVIEDSRQLVQDFLAPELREIRGVLSGSISGWIPRTSASTPWKKSTAPVSRASSSALKRFSNPSPSTSASPALKTTSGAPHSTTSAGSARAATDITDILDRNRDPRMGFRMNQSFTANTIQISP